MTSTPELQLNVNLFDLVSRPDGPASMKEKMSTIDSLIEELLIYDGPVSNAIKNFCGVLKYHCDTEGPSEALNCFREILQEDKENLNALQNCKYVNKKIMKASDENRHEATMTKLLSDTNMNRQLLLARFHAELGYAMSFEFSFDRDREIFDYERFHTATVYFERALNRQEVFTVSESCQWQFFAARAYHRLYDRLLKRKLPVEGIERDNIIIRCMGLFHFVIQNTDDARYKSKAWCLLGSVLSKLPRDHKGRPTYTEQLTAFISECKFQREHKNPSLCFQKACHLRPDDFKLFLRHARMFMSQHFRDFE